MTVRNDDPLPRLALHHVALTVTDVEASTGWYEKVFSIRLRLEAPHQGGTGLLLADDAWQLIIVLHRHDTNEREGFAETRTGLDHVGFAVASRADLKIWQARLEELGIVVSDAADRPLTQSPIADTPQGSVLVFRDPDNIQLELYSPPNV